MKEIILQDLFKKWFVKRPNGNCQVLFALSELDDFCDEIEKFFNKPTKVEFYDRKNKPIKFKKI